MQKLPANLFDDLLFPGELDERDAETADVYVLAFQEAPGDKRELLARAQAALGAFYVLFDYCELGTLLLGVFFKRELIWYSSGTPSTSTSHFHFHFDYEHRNCSLLHIERNFSYSFQFLQPTAHSILRILYCTVHTYTCTYTYTVLYVVADKDRVMTRVTLTTKGGVAIAFNFFGTSFLFIGAHLYGTFCYYVQ